MSPHHSSWTKTYNQRAYHPSTSPLASYLLRLMSIKKTNLSLSADVETSAELLSLAEEVGDSICILKTHCDIIADWTERTAKALRDIARRKNFLIFEDRKFADIGGTVQKQYTSGHYRIAQWAEITNAHILPGPAIVTALHKAADVTIAKYNTAVHTEISADPAEITEEDEDWNGTAEELAVESPMEDDAVGGERKLSTPRAPDRKASVVSISTTISMRHESISPRPQTDFSPDEAFALDSSSLLAQLGEAPYLRSLLLLAEMSSEGHLLTGEYTQTCAKIARQNREFIMGFIAQHSLNEEEEDNFLTMTPGCQLPPPGKEGTKLGDGLGQQYNTPRNIIYEKGCDIIIVGRGIVNAVNRQKEAERYRAEGWKAYEERITPKKGLLQTFFANLALSTFRSRSSSQSSTSSLLNTPREGVTEEPPQIALGDTSKTSKGKSKKKRKKRAGKKIQQRRLQESAQHVLDLINQSSPPPSPTPPECASAALTCESLVDRAMCTPEVCARDLIGSRPNSRSYAHPQIIDHDCVKSPVPQFEKCIVAQDPISGLEILLGFKAENVHHDYEALVQVLEHMDWESLLAMQAAGFSGVLDI